MLKIMKYNKIISCILASVLSFSACTSTFDDLNTNPDATTQVKSSMLATYVIKDMVTTIWEYNEFLSRRLFWGEQINNAQYNRFGSDNFGYIQKIINAQKMMELASEEDKEAYTGLYYFMKGWNFWRCTLSMGDIPYSQALNIEEYPYPAYDAQKDVFMGILSDLEQADLHFAKATQNFEGDPFYNGDIQKWRKATNVLRLKVLISLSKRADDTPELKIKETFSKIVEEGNLFQSNEDNLQVIYSDKQNQQNPFHNSFVKSINEYAGSALLIDPLKEFQDYRLFYYFEPAQALTDELYLPEGQQLLQASDWDAYQGLDVAAPFGEESKKIANKMHARPNDIYRLSYVGMPYIRLGYADMNFTIAEAIERGWLSGDAKAYYEKGIRASFDFIRTYEPVEYCHGREITDEYINSYLVGDKVAYKTSGSSIERLKQIWIQAYIARYFHMQYDDYYDYRRNSYPEFPINPDTNLNDDKYKIPMRWQYPENELLYNKEQYLAALERQWNGTDNVNNIMWLLK